MADNFNEKIKTNNRSFPNTIRGRTLIIVADFGGHHKKQHFDTYTFLVLDVGKNTEWMQKQHYFRTNILPNKRRMSFKCLNDSMRRQALIPFFQMASGIEGYLSQFAVSKMGGSLFNDAPSDKTGEDLLSLWKPAVRERLLRVIHMSCFLLSGLSAPGQDVLWIIDQDDITANILQLNQLTEVFVRVLSNYLAHGLRKIRCGTTMSDDGSLRLEDLAAIADLTTGALGEVCTGFIDQSLFPRKGIILNRPGISGGHLV